MTTYTGTVRGGAIVLDDAPPLPDGARVSVSVAADAPAPPATDPPRPPAPMSPEEAALLDEFVAETYRLRRLPRMGESEEP